MPKEKAPLRRGAFSTLSPAHDNRRSLAPKVYRRKQNPVTVTYADGTVEVVYDWHNSTLARRAAEDRRKKLRKQKWAAARKRKKRT